MVWFFVLGTVALAMVASDRIWSNPVSIFGAMFLGFCMWLLVGVAIKGMGI